MAAEDCLEVVRKAIGEGATDDDLDKIFTDVDTEIRRRGAVDDGVLAEDALRTLGRELAEKEQIAALVAKREKAINLRKRLETEQFVTSQFGNDFITGLESILVGTNKSRLGSRMSAAAAQEALKGKYLGGFIYDVERTGNWKLFVSGEIDRDISKALGEINKPNPVLDDIPDPAVDVARVIRKYQEAVRHDANKAGAWIGQRDDFIVSQTHDMFKIRKSSKEEWIAFISDKLDESTFDGVGNRQKFLENVYQNLATGIHMSHTGGDVPSGFKGGRNIAKRMSEGRLLHFKTPDDWFDYNQQFGVGSLRETLLYSFDNMASNIGLMRTLGPNPQNNFEQIANNLAARLDTEGDIKKISKFDQARKGKLANRLAEVDGSVNIPGSLQIAKWASATRAIQTLSKLGSVTLAAFPDIGFVGSEMHFNGIPFLQAQATGFKGLFKGRTKAYEKEVLSGIGIFSDSMAGSITARFATSQDDLPGKTSKLMQTFFKLNGLTWWTDRLRESAGLTLSNNLATHSGKRFTSIPRDTQNILSNYGIDADLWDLARSPGAKKFEGKAFFTPEQARDIDDAAVVAYLNKKGLKPTNRAVANLKEEIEDKFRTYFIDRSQSAIIQPDARTNAVMFQGIQKGTVVGEIWRMFAQFKSFPIAVLQKAVGREIYGRGSDTLSEALRNGNGEMQGLAQMILVTTALGYLSLTAKDLARGKAPRDPQDAKGYGKLIAGSMLQGGALGIYGDFLFGDLKNRYGGNIVSALAGPTAGQVITIADLIGTTTEGKDPTAKAFRLAINNVPFSNLWWSRGALDLMVLYRAQEALSPGYLRRMERRMQKENDQEFLISPSVR